MEITPSKNFTRFFEWRLLLAPLLGVALYRLWVGVAESGRYPAFVLPHPEKVWQRFEMLYHDGTLMQHLKITLQEALYGLAIAAVCGITLGYLVARIRLLNYTLIPYLLFIQAVPIIAISPLIVIWVGPDLASKVVITALITWFPLMIATIVGVRNVSPNLRELMRAQVARPWQVFWHLELPSALPEILGGFKIAVTLSVIGAAVGEFVSSRQGLGHLVFFGKAISDTPLVICGVLLLTLTSLTLYSLVTIIEWFLLSWKRAGNSWR